MNSIIKYIVSFLSIALAILFLWYFLKIITYILIAGVLSLIGNPLVDWLSRLQIKRFKPPRALWAGLTLVFLWTVFIGFFSFFIPLVINQAYEISKIDVDLLITKLHEPLIGFENLMLKLKVSGFETFDFKVFLTEKVVSIVGNIQVTDFLNTIARAFGDLVIAIFAISFILFFFLKEEKLFNNLLLGAMPSKFEMGFEKALKTIYYLLARYFVGITIDIFLIITLLSVGLFFLGLPVSTIFVIAFLAGILNVVPYIGPIIGVFLGLTLTVTANLNLDFNNELLPLLIKVLAIFGIVQIIDVVVFQPLIYSSSVNAHPLEIFLVILTAGSIGGILGMFLAIPGYTVLRVISKEFFNQYKIVNKLTKNI